MEMVPVVLFAYLSQPFTQSITAEKLNQAYCHFKYYTNLRLYLMQWFCIELSKSTVPHGKARYN